MLNVEEIFIKIVQLLDFPLEDIKIKGTRGRNRFTTQEESNAKYIEHMASILKILNIDKQNKRLIIILKDLLFLYQNIYDKLLLFSDKSSEKKINWIILKRLIVPFLAYKFASLDVNYDDRIDKNMPGGLFWYLPDVRDPSNIKMPIQYIMKWWLDLYGGSIDSLCNDIDENIISDEFNMSINTLKPWIYNGIVPSRKSLLKYLNTPIQYQGVFTKNENCNINEEYQRVLDFINKNKKISIEDLRHEIPCNSIIDNIFHKREISEFDKKEFVKHVSERWSIPKEKYLKNKFIVGMSIHKAYMSLLKYFDFTNSADIEENKIIQLVHEYQVLYNIHIQRRIDNNNSFDIYGRLGYEMLVPFYTTDANSIIKTIYGDITIELFNPDIKIDTLEDIYALKINLFKAFNDKRLGKSIIEQKKFHDYFTIYFDKVNARYLEYKHLTDENFLIKLKDEENFAVIHNLSQNFEKEYFILKNIYYQMIKIAKNKNEKMLSLVYILSINTMPSIKGNENELLETKKYFMEYKTKAPKINESMLMIEGSLYLKSKEFKKSLMMYDDFFEKYVKYNNKNDISILNIYLACYCAYTVNDKGKLKKYNQALRKLNYPEFKTKKDLHIPIYFYT